MLKISNLSFSYHNHEVLNSVNLTIATPTKIAIIGDNGSGKTTFLKLLNGELTPDTGKIRLDGQIGYLPQTPETSTQSGGEITKSHLEKLFAHHYDILLLDEPTNNLDTEAQAWLVTQLQKFQGLVLFVSHDCALIHQVAEQIIHIKTPNLTLFNGNYASYQAHEAQLHAQIVKTYQQAQKNKQHLKRQLNHLKQQTAQTGKRHFDKHRDENRMVFNQHRSAAQNRLGKSINNTQRQLDHLDHVAQPIERKTYQAQVTSSFLRHRRLLKVDSLTKQFDEHPLFHGLTFELYTGERLQITGRNGAGKTTLLKIILGELSPDSGSMQLTPNLNIGYISQTIFGLDLTQSFLAQTNAQPTALFQAAATMDLTKEQLTIPCAELSRGQLTKLAFLKIILQPVDLLILDEPTNHLDLRARENIERALASYPGAIILVSHDTTFAQQIHCSKIVNL